MTRLNSTCALRRSTVDRLMICRHPLRATHHILVLLARRPSAFSEHALQSPAVWLKAGPNELVSSFQGGRGARIFAISQSQKSLSVCLFLFSLPFCLSLSLSLSLSLFVAALHSAALACCRYDSTWTMRDYPLTLLYGFMSIG